jgi:hypothetical protein
MYCRWCAIPAQSMPRPERCDATLQAGTHVFDCTTLYSYSVLCAVRGDRQMAKVRPNWRKCIPSMGA